MYVGMYVCVFTIIEIRRSPDTYLNLFQDRQCKLAKYLFYLHKRASAFLNIPSSATIISLDTSLISQQLIVASNQPGNTAKISRIAKI